MCANIYNIWGDNERAKNVIQSMYEKCVRRYSWVEKNANWSYTDLIILSDAEFGLGNYQASLDYINKCLEHEPNNIAFLKRKIDCLEHIKANS